MTGLRVLVIGGGYAGVAVARALDERHQVVMLEQRPAFFHNVAALRAVVDASWSDRIQFRYDRLLRRGAVEHGQATEIEAGQVRLADGRVFTGDVLVVATGSTQPFPAKPNGGDLPGMLERLSATAAALALARSALILGAGAVGLELAGEIASAHPGIDVTVVDPAATILPGPYRPRLRRQLLDELRGLGIRILLQDTVDTTVLGQDGELVTGRRARTAQERDVPADVWFRAFGSRPETGGLAGTLAAAVGADGRLAVDPHLHVVGHDRVFAAGDVTDVAEPKTAIAAARHAKVITTNVDALAHGRRGTAVYRPPATAAMVLPLGPAHGAAQLPLAGGLVLGRRFASLIKGRDLLVPRTQAALHDR